MTHADLLQNGFGFLTVGEHVVWLNYQHRERAGAIRPPISVVVTSEEVCGAAGERMRGWGTQPYAVELHYRYGEAGLRCLRGLSPQYLGASGGSCDALVENDLLPEGLRGLAIGGCSDASLRAIARLPHLETLSLGTRSRTSVSRFWHKPRGWTRSRFPRCTGSLPRSRGCARSGCAR